MLSEMRITGLGVIADATLSFSEGFTVVTGETGAGKTMVVAGLGLLLGGRADPAKVRADVGKATVEGRIFPPTDDDVANALAALDATPDDDGSVIVARSVHANGRSRAHVGGRAAPVGFLAELGERLVAVHGQSDQLRLLRPQQQRAALDRLAFGQQPEQLEAFRQLFAEWQACEAELLDRVTHARARAQEADVLRVGIAEIEAVAPQPGEDTALRAEAERLEHAEGLGQAAVVAHQAFNGDPAVDDAADVTRLIGTAQRMLAEQAEHDPALAGFHQRTMELAALANELAADLASYAESAEADPARLAVVHERRAALAQLTRKYADDIDGVLAWVEQAQSTLDSLDSSEETLAVLRAQRDKLSVAVASAAAELTIVRQAAAERFGKAVTAELAGLAMADASVVAEVRQRAPHEGESAVTIDGAEVAVCPDGADEVEISLIAHPGAPPLPLQRGASGGELSRVMLAIEVVFADVSGSSTMVFDEVDAGVGGKAAVEIGRRLAQLASTHQVLAVTHLPQVAAFAAHHLVVEKGNDGAVTTSGVRAVTGDDRVRELARMLAGLEESEVGLAHAAELLELGQRAGTTASVPR